MACPTHSACRQKYHVYVRWGGGGRREKQAIEQHRRADPPPRRRGTAAGARRTAQSAPAQDPPRRRPRVGGWVTMAGAAEMAVAEVMEMGPVWTRVQGRSWRGSAAAMHPQTRVWDGTPASATTGGRAGACEKNARPRGSDAVPDAMVGEPGAQETDQATTASATRNGRSVRACERGRRRCA